MSPNNDNVNYYEKFKAYLEELVRDFSELAGLLSQKLIAIRMQKLAEIESIMKREQVFEMKLKSFDTYIQMYRDKLSLKGDSLSDVILELPEEYRFEFGVLRDKLRSLVGETAGLNKRCQALLDERIHYIERAMHEIDKSNTTAYGGQGGTPPVSPGSDAFVLKKSI